MLAAVAALALASPAPAGAVAAAPAVRMPAGELAGEYWDVIARLDSGHLLIAQTYISNLGPGDRSAGAVGYLVSSDGKVESFKRSEPEGKWRLVDGRWIDLHSVELDPAGPPRRFSVGRDELGVDLVMKNGGAPRNGGTISSACPVELLEMASPADAELRTKKGAAPKKTRAHVAMTHRWTQSLESDCTLRRVELFVLERELGLYFSETTTPDGALHRWLVVRRGERVVFEGDPGAAKVRWSTGAGGFAPPDSVRFSVAGIEAHVRFEEEPLATLDPTERLSVPVQLLVATRSRPRLSWMRAPYDVSVSSEGGKSRSFRGDAVAKVSYLNPLAEERVLSRLAVPAEE